MTFSDDDGLKELLADQGFTPTEIEDAIQSRKDLLTIEQIQAMAARERHHSEDIDGAIATIAEDGTELSPINGKRLFTHADWGRVQTEIIQRKMRRLHQDHTLVALSQARSNRMSAHIEHPSDQALNDAAQDKLETAVKSALRHGAHIDDISTAASLEPQTIREIRDAHL